MLKALSTLTQDSIIIVDPRWSAREAEIRGWSRDRYLRCSVCHAEVIFKAGNERQWHFAHRHRQDCLLSHTPPDVLQARQVLYEWLPSKFPEATIDLEVIHPEISRVIDCTITYRDKRIAFVLIHHQIRNQRERTDLIDTLQNAFTHVNFLVLPTLQDALQGNSPTINLSTTERDLRSTTLYDQMEHDFLERPRKGTLHYLEDNTLITYRNLYPTYHSAQEFRGRKRVTLLQEVLISQRGELAHPGEFESYRDWEKKRKKAQIQLEKQQRSLSFGFSSPPPLSASMKLNSATSRHEANQPSPPVRPQKEDALLPTNKNLFNPSNIPGYRLQFTTPKGITSPYPRSLSTIEECHSVIKLSLPNFISGTTVKIISEVTGEVVEDL